MAYTGMDLMYGNVEFKEPVYDDKGFKTGETDKGEKLGNLKINETLTLNELGHHSQEKYNHFKSCELREIRMSTLIGMSFKNVQSTDWGSWRTALCKGTDGEKMAVRDEIQLVPEKYNTDYSIEFEYGYAWDDVLNSTFVQKINDVAEKTRLLASTVGAKAVIAGEYIPRWKRIPSLKDIKPMNFGNWRFNFEFGSAGLFDAKEEVVKPIVALVSLFVPQGSGNFVYANVPSLEYEKSIFFNWISSDIVSGIKTIFGKSAKAAMNALSSLGSGGGDSDSGDSGGDAAASGGDAAASGGGQLFSAEVTKGFQDVAAAATAVQDTINSTMNAAAQAVAASITGVQLRIGRQTLPPFIVKDIGWGFDSSQVDEYGYPYKGYVELKNCEGIAVPTYGIIGSALSGTETDFDSDSKKPAEIKPDAKTATQNP